MKRAAPVVLGTLLALLCEPPVARGQAEAGARLVGSAQLGYRYVDVNGREQKYREDLNLSSGARLFKLELDIVPPAGLRENVDKIELALQNLGGDPFETFRATIDKHGRYRLKFERRKSDYFYDDLLVPGSLANPLLSDVGDLHTFDFERVQDSALLELRFAGSARLTLGFDGYRRTGSGRTTLDVQRDEFELEQPIDERMNEYHGAFQYGWKGATLVLEERVRDYSNGTEIFLPGRSAGEDPEDLSVLDFLFLDRPYDLTTFSHGARVVANPGERLTVQAAATLEDTRLDLATSERSAGTDFQGLRFATELEGEGDVRRDTTLLDLDLSFLIDERVALLASARRHELTQRGELLLDSELGGGEWDIDHTSFEAGLRIGAGRRLTLSGGLRHQVRDVSSAREDPEAGRVSRLETRGTGYFANVGWRSPRRFRLRVGYEDGSYEGPFTLRSPTGKRMLRVRGQYGGGEGFSASLSYRLARSENDESEWRADYDALNLRLGYRVASFSTSLGYSRVEIERSIDQLVDFGETSQARVPIAYDAAVDSFDGRVIWSFVEGWRLGGVVRLYESRGSWRVDRVDVRGWLEAEIGRQYVAHLGVRGVDYGEPVRGLNAYDARIVEVSLGYRW